MCQALYSVFYMLPHNPPRSGFTFNIYRQRNTEPERLNKFSKVTVSGGAQTHSQVCLIRKPPINLASKNENQTTTQ